MLRSSTLIVILLLGFFSMLLFSLNTCNNDSQAPTIWTGATTATTPDGRIDNTTSTKKTTSAQTSSSTLDPNFNPFEGNWHCTAGGMMTYNLYFEESRRYTEDMWLGAGDCVPPRWLLQGVYDFTFYDLLTGIWSHDYDDTYLEGDTSCKAEDMVETPLGNIAQYESGGFTFNPSYTSLELDLYGVQCTKVISDGN